jgi:hypothetical protein
MFTRLAERRLQQRHESPVEVLNFGRSGMTQTDQLLILRRDVLAFSPDIVVLVFVPINDIDEISPRTADDLLRPFYIKGENGKGKNGALILDTGFVERRSFLLKRLINPFKQHSALISLGMERYNLLRRSRRRADVASHGDGGITGALTLCTSAPAPIYKENYALNKRIMREIVQACRDHNSRLLLVCGSWAYKTDDLARRTKDDPSFDMRFFESDLGTMADSLGVAYLGLQSVFENHYQTNRRPLHWEHWNYEGHRLVAESLAGKLETLIDGEDK